MANRSLNHPRHCSSVYAASRSYVDANASGASRSAASRTSRTSSQSPDPVARTDTMRAAQLPTLEVSQEQTAALVRKNEVTLSAADDSSSHGPGSQCCHVVRPLCLSRPIRGWSGG